MIEDIIVPVNKCTFPSSGLEDVSDVFILFSKCLRMLLACNFFCSVDSVRLYSRF